MRLFAKSVEKTYLYRAYGLVVESPIELPELRPGKGRPDVRIRFDAVERRPSEGLEMLEGGKGFWSEGDTYCHYREGTGVFSVTGGEEIVIDAHAVDGGEPDDSLVRLAILGPALGLVLIQRGHFLLHASAVEFGGVAVAFLGCHGAGKSTLAASLFALGHPMVTDDVVAVDRTTGDVHVLPSFPQLKLWDDSARDLGLTPSELPRVHPEVDKWAWRPGNGATEKPIPLRRLYVLGIGDEIEIEDLPPHEASQYVMTNWFGARFGPGLFRAQDQGEHFRQCIELADSVSIRRLVRPRVDGGFASLARQIEDVIRVDLALEI